MDLRSPVQPRKSDERVERSVSIFRGYAESLVCLGLCFSLFGTLLYMTMWASFIGGLLLTVIVSCPGAIAGALMARISHRVVRSVSTTRWLSPLNVSFLMTLLAAGLISYIAFDKAITGSVVTGISTIGPLGPILAVPAGWYFWIMAKRFSFLI